MKKKTVVRESHFPVGIFSLTFIVLLVVSAVHMMIIYLFDIWKLAHFERTILAIGYWIVISMSFTVFTRWQMKKAYEIPMKELAHATDAVAHGNFAVYVSPIHTPEKLDYLDVMIMDFNKMVEELGSIETLKTDFFSNVSHEIKTPLATISNYAQLLRKEKLSQEQMEYVEGILLSTRKLTDLITNILKLNRLEKQSIQPQFQIYDLSEQLCECALQFESLWEKKQIEFIADIEDKNLIKADKSLMELMWNNLLSNALKFTEPGGTIMLKESSTAEEVIVKVIDTGCGMDKHTKKHIFDKFYQGDTSHATEGNGLGLALVLRILQISGGSVSVDSKIGKGTEFTIVMSKSLE